MTKANSQKNDENKKAAAPQIQLSSPEPTTPVVSRNKGNKKNQRPQVGGTAVAGARSTLPKQAAGTNPSEQQYEASNRDMRRRTRRMGTDPQSQLEAANARNPRQKKLEKRRQRLEERRAEIRRSGPKKIDKSVVNRRSLYVFLGALAVILIVVIIAIIVRHPFG